MTTQKTQPVDLDKYDTYAWLPSKDNLEDENYNEELLYSTIVSEVNQNMQSVGYDLERQNPDLLVKVSTMFDRETTRTTDPIYATYTYNYPTTYIDPFYEPYYYYDYASVPRVVGYDVDEVAYTEGTFVIDLIDSETNNIVWRGWVEEAIQPENLRSEIRNYVEEVFEEYPS